MNIPKLILKHRRSELCNVLLNFKNYSTKRQVEEIQIPVPWGYLAGKWWGPQNRRPILGLHGWQDNCGTFDRLAPLLPDHIGFLAIDCPGHGLSSKIPAGFYYYEYNYVIVLRRIMEYFKWQKMSLIGHSMGSIISFLYSSLYSNHVDMLIGIDLLKPVSHLPGGQNTVLSENINRFLKYDRMIQENVEPPSYTYEEMINKYYEGTHGSVSKEYAHHLLDRSIAPSKNNPNKYYFTRDPRLKSGLLPGFIHDEIVTFAEKITCPIMNIKAKDSPFFEDKKYYFEVLEILKKASRDCQQIQVAGTHHLHLLTPERIIEPINAFILKHHTKDDPVEDLQGYES